MKQPRDLPDGGPMKTDISKQTEKEDDKAEEERVAGKYRRPHPLKPQVVFA